jgi:uncharacterized protein
MRRFFMKTSLKIAIFSLLTTLLFAGFVFAQDIRTRMIERLPAIKELKVKGIIGENNKGYLEFIGEKKEGQDVVADENGDRKKVYDAIARREAVSVEIVGQRRALQIAKVAEKGEWLQDAQGKWYKK